MSEANNMSKEAMKLALEDYLSREMPAGTVIGDPKWWAGKIANVLAKQEQGEPVAWVDLLKDAEQIVKDKFLYKRFIDGTPLANDIPCWMVDFAQQYTTPQQPSAIARTAAEGEDTHRAWVGLTDIEINDLVHSHDDFDGLWEFADAVEAKLKEKNT